jgi:hypothetical protein
VAGGEVSPARRGAGRRGLWPVSRAAHVRVPGNDGETEREGERKLAGGPAHGMGPIRQRNEERRREWQVGPAAIQLNSKYFKTVRT